MIASLLLCTCSSPPPEDCADVSTVATAQVQMRTDSHAGGCTRDDDCTLVEASLSCYHGCQRAVLKGQEMAAMADLDLASGVVCGDTQCDVTAGCVPVFARCQGGSCHTIEGVADAGQGDGGKRDGG